MFPASTFYLNAMDPGGTTGLSLLLVTEETFTVEKQVSSGYRPDKGESPIRVLKNWRRSYDDHPHVMVYENFHIRPGRASTDITAFGLIVAMEHWVMDDSPYAEVAPQEPAVAKRLVPDSILERIDLKVYGPDARHINDSNRHAATYLASRSYMPLCLQAWPPGATRVPLRP